MKKLRLLAPMAILLSAIVFAGCGDDDDRHEEELNRRIDQLEKEVESLREKDTAAKEETPVSGGSLADTEESAVSGNSDNDTIDSLTNAVNEVTKKADSAVPSGNADEKRTQFFELKDELDIVDRRLDVFDDYIEKLYKSGEIPYDDYRDKEKTLEELEDKLDASEDNLEFSFGIDD